MGAVVKINSPALQRSFQASFGDARQTEPLSKSQHGGPRSMLEILPEIARELDRFFKQEAAEDSAFRGEYPVAGREALLEGAVLHAGALRMPVGPQKGADTGKYVCMYLRNRAEKILFVITLYPDAQGHNQIVLWKADREDFQESRELQDSLERVIQWLKDSAPHAQFSISRSNAFGRFPFALAAGYFVKKYRQQFPNEPQRALVAAVAHVRTLFDFTVTDRKKATFVNQVGSIVKEFFTELLRDLEDERSAQINQVLGVFYQLQRDRKISIFPYLLKRNVVPGKLDDTLIAVVDDLWNGSPHKDSYLSSLRSICALFGIHDRLSDDEFERRLQWAGDIFAALDAYRNDQVSARQNREKESSRKEIQYEFAVYPARGRNGQIVTVITDSEDFENRSSTLPATDLPDRKKHQIEALEELFSSSKNNSPDDDIPSPSERSQQTKKNRRYVRRENNPKASNDSIATKLEQARLKIKTWVDVKKWKQVAPWIKIGLAEDEAQSAAAFFCNVLQELLPNPHAEDANSPKMVFASISKQYLLSHIHNSAAKNFMLLGQKNTDRISSFSLAGALERAI
ncbi:MAG: hypothetical protein NC924_07780 [Candidatus Omnitrophica bacterium]|nr:hypothetical protein [Candidatus Omnitrophota bacterium]